MNRTLSLLALATLGFVSATTLAPPAAPSTPSASARPIVVPRQKIGLTCTDTYFTSPRQNYLLLDESYPLCILRLPLALRQRWPGARTFYFIPRVSATLYAKDSRGNGKWLPLSPLVNPGADALHRSVDSASYKAVELTGQFKKLSDVAGQNRADTVSAGGKLTVCGPRPGRRNAVCHLRHHGAVQGLYALEQFVQPWSLILPCRRPVCCRSWCPCWPRCRSGRVAGARLHRRRGCA